MENATVKLSADLDPQNQRTQLSIRQIRSERRVWSGLAIGVGVGSVLGFGLWLWQFLTAPTLSSTDDLVPAFGEEAPLRPSPLRVDETESNGPVVEEVATDLPVRIGGAQSTATKAPSRPARQQPTQSTKQKSGESARDEPEQNKVWVKPKSERKVWLK